MRVKTLAENTHSRQDGKVTVSAPPRSPEAAIVVELLGAIKCIKYSQRGFKVFLADISKDLGAKNQRGYPQVLL